jgi:hypothetical protein
MQQTRLIKRQSRNAPLVAIAVADLLQSITGAAARLIDLAGLPRERIRATLWAVQVSNLRPTACKLRV